MSEHWAVVPVRGLNESKSRLSSYLGDYKRLLVEALLRDVLSSIIQSQVYGRVVVISPDESVAVQARLHGVSFQRQTGLGLNRAIEQMNVVAMKEGARSLTVILADIPLMEPEDFREFLSLGGGDRKVLMVPSLKGGTNMMTTWPPGVIRPQYGRWSYSKHLRQAQAVGVRIYSIADPHISFDIDTVSDLNELLRRDGHRRSQSARVLQEIGPLLNSAKSPSENAQPIIG